jgi:hypothetical protein
MSKNLILAAAAWTLSASAHAADPPPIAPAGATPTPAPSSSLDSAPAKPAVDPSIAPAGTLVFVEIAETVSTKTRKQGERFAIRLASPITANGKVIMPAGAMGEGQVVDVAAASALGTPAKLVLAARYVEFAGLKAPLRGLKLGATGANRYGLVTSLALVPYVGVLGAFVKGEEIEIPAGTYASAKLAEDVSARADASSGDATLSKGADGVSGAPPGPPAANAQPEPAKSTPQGNAS